MESDTGQIESYLLGKLDERETNLFEERLFADDQLLEQCRWAEEELIESYIQNRLSDVDRERFKARFLQSPDRRLRVGIAHDLRARFTVAQPLPAPKPGLWQIMRTWMGAHPAVMASAFAGC